MRLTFWLSSIGIGSALGYAAALLRFPLLGIYAQPIQNLDKLTGSNGWIGLSLAVGVLALFGLYALGALALAAGASGLGSRAGGATLAPSPRSQALLALMLIGFPLLFLALLVFVYPTSSVDLYDYMFRGRMLVRYGANTFIDVPSDFKSDPLFWYVAWRRAVTAYGPLWEGLSWLTARLAGEAPGLPGAGASRDAELLRLMLAYKGLAALGFLSCGAAIWLVLRRSAPEWRWLGLYLWLWNPLALWESLAAGHNDAWMAALIVLAVGAMSERQIDRVARRQGDKVTIKDGVTPSPPDPLTPSIGAFVALTLGGLVKFLALMFGPLLLAAALRRLPNARARLRLVLLGGLVCGGLVALAYAPFWVGWGTLRNFGDRGTLFTSSWLAVLQAPLTLGPLKAAVGAPSLLALLVSKDYVQPAAVGIGLGLLGLGVLWASWRSWRAPGRLAGHALWLLLWFLFLCNPWFQPWYLLWALALLAAQPWRPAAARLVVVFCCTGMLSYLAGVFLLPALGWSGDGAEWNALTSALLYLPPLLAPLWGWRLAGSVRSRASAAPARPEGGASAIE